MKKNTIINDDSMIRDFEGKFSHGGGLCMLNICDKLNRKFITDEDIDELIMTSINDDTNEIEITNEMYENRTNNFRKILTIK